MGTAYGGFQERKHQVPKVHVAYATAVYTLRCFRAILGYFFLPSTMKKKKKTNALHAMLGDLFLGCPCTLCSYHQAVAGLRTSKQLGTCSDWPQRSVSSFAGISLKPRVALLLKLSAGGRDPLGFCFMALLQSPISAKDSGALGGGSRSILVFQRFPCEADNSDLYLSFPSKG